MPVDTTRTWRATRPTRRPTVDLCAAPRTFFTNPRAPTAHSHPDFFLAPSRDVRLWEQPLVTQTS